MSEGRLAVLPDPDGWKRCAWCDSADTYPIRSDGYLRKCRRCGRNTDRRPA